MATPIPITLSGNLGERHCRLNELVNIAAGSLAFLSVRDLDEQSAIDRLFKIDLASKQKNVEYIIQTLKDDDMLYVSRALKCSWLLNPEFSGFINPKFLEDELYPQMRLQAVNKMRKWIEKHLKDPQRCREFYQHYRDIDFVIAGKFLCYCSEKYILNEVIRILDKITPKLLKRLSEKVPLVTKIYFGSLRFNQALLTYYLKNDRAFFTTVKYLVKNDPDVFFDVVENFYVCQTFPRFQSEITKHIIKNHKQRFNAKPELYTAWLLNVKALAKCLNSEEIKDLVVKMARAEYLEGWFSYQNVEPFFKALSVEERTSFKKKIFIDKDIGSPVTDWPYAAPKPPTQPTPQTGIFREIGCSEYSCLTHKDNSDMTYCYSFKCEPRLKRTFLDQLFEEFRFVGFKQTLFELRKRLRAESSAQNRQYMFLVMVSKTGGREGDLTTLIDLLTKYKNEPVQIRAAIFRSLVKRAFIWRLSNEPWTKLLEWGHDLGLDGRTPEATCVEGIHAMVLRHLLANVTPSPSVWEAYFSCFSNFTSYKLTANERKSLIMRLPGWVAAEAAKEPDGRFGPLMDILSTYRIKLDQCPDAVDTIKNYAKSADNPNTIFVELYRMRSGRKIFFREMFEAIHTDASYVNALRHEISVLQETERFQKQIINQQRFNDLKHGKFFRKLAIYFAEKDGLAQRYRAELQLSASILLEEQEENAKAKKLGRPLALLASSTFSGLLEHFDSKPRSPVLQILVATLRANAHVVRPSFDLDSFGWHAAGAKAVANRVVTCRQTEMEKYLQECLDWRRSMRLALKLAQRMNKEREVFEIIASKRPGVALKAGLRYFRRQGINSDPLIWKIVKPILEAIDYDHHKKLCYYSITALACLPLAFMAEYYVVVYKLCKQSCERTSMSILCQICNNMLPDVEEEFIIEEIQYFLQFSLHDNSILFKADFVSPHQLLHVGMIAKFLLLCTTEEILEKRLEIAGLPFFKLIENIWKTSIEEKDVKKVVVIRNILYSFLFALKFNKVIYDNKYTAGLPLFESIIKWLHGFLPIEKWFDLYSEIHLTLIYYKSVRHCLKQTPNLFSDESTKLLKGVKMLGTTYGQFISNEIEELTERYFPTIVKLYGKGVEDYLNKYFGYSYDQSIELLTIGVIKGMLSQKLVSSHIVARHVFEKFRRGFEDDSCQEILKEFVETENKELRLRFSFCM